MTWGVAAAAIGGWVHSVNPTQSHQPLQVGMYEGEGGLECLRGLGRGVGVAGGGSPPPELEEAMKLPQTHHKGNRGRKAGRAEGGG